MRKLVLTAVAALALTGCVKDRGQCLQSHVEHSEGYFYTTFIMAGQTMVPITNYVPPSDNIVCDRWEFPQGRAKK